MKFENHNVIGRIIPCMTVALMAAFAAPAFAQNEVQLLVKHLKTSRDFTLKVADQMADADYAERMMKDRRVKSVGKWANFQARK